MRGSEGSLEVRVDSPPAAPAVRSPVLTSTPAQAALEAALEALARAPAGDVQAVASAEMRIGTSLFDGVRGDARASYRWALASAGVGTAFFGFAIVALQITYRTDLAVVSALGGALAQGVAGLKVWHAGRLSRQLHRLHDRLDELQRFVLANSVAETLPDEDRRAAKQELVRTISASAGAANLVGASSAGEASAAVSARKSGG